MGVFTNLCYSMDVARLWGTNDLRMFNVAFECLGGVCHNKTWDICRVFSRELTCGYSLAHAGAIPFFHVDVLGLSNDDDNSSS